ncbi:hypothetical protein [Streptomyces colonosanans]|uniref:Uncharacterized protein n=1 Tax=Streptomyces colonosanans TaxID=1428652 RepID=A0A1S2P3R2_9ACTN|nr:hypothetical protein [Streptomyces colonosanans]OIJ88065.1 hypothetical protein BIV24_23200 [Streptomyces colonosanans]
MTISTPRNPLAGTVYTVTLRGVRCVRLSVLSARSIDNRERSDTDALLLRVIHCDSCGGRMYLNKQDSRDTFFNGETANNPKSFGGLRKRLAGSQVLPADMPVIGNGTTDTYAFFDKLEELVDHAPGLDGSNGAIYTNALGFGKIRAAARRVGGVKQAREDLTRKEVTR